MKKIVIAGFGRMGITHCSIINGLYPNQYDITIVEPKKIIGLITRKTLGYKVASNLAEVEIEDAFVLITTPPSIHPFLCDVALSKGAKAIFVEKPFGLFDNRVKDNTRISVGYVLRFSEVAQRLKSIILEEGCKRIKLDYSSHTLTKPTKGWRNTAYGGVLNEMGSHLVDLMLYLGGGGDFEVLNSSIQSVVSDVDDVVFVNGRLGNIEIELTLNWINPDFRKPIWSGLIQTPTRTIIFDQQSIDGGFDTDSVDYYVRGRDFSVQMKHFIEEDRSIACTSEEANRVHDVITKIKEKA